ncbi:MAG: radical SAM protein [Anaerovoracaceae bacterium]
MKKHAIIPIFIPHRGCQNDCVFCNQKIITARSADVTPLDVRNIIEEYLPTLVNRNIETIEVAFFGGSFTGLPMDQQSVFLEVAKEYKDAGKINKIHMSTRPDYIDEAILDNLEKYSVDIIELGVQSFDPEVLAASKRGHSVEQVYRACNLIRNRGIELGIQLMIGLPSDTMEKSIMSAKKTAEIRPSLARLYPTVVLEDTELINMCKIGKYKPLDEKMAAEITKEMYLILHNAGINIMRVGLKSTDLITPESDFGGGYHPAFRQLVEGEISRQILDKQLMEISITSKIMEKTHVVCRSNPKWFNNMIGHKGCNKAFFAKKYPHLSIAYRVDESLDDITFTSKKESIR